MNAPQFARPSYVQALALLGWLALCYLAAAIGAVASVNAPAFYGELGQPSWAPPAWLFGPVWTGLYTLMAIAAWLVWRAAPLAETRLALGLFLVQLAVNALWSWLFFAWQLGGWAFAEVLLLWVLIAATIAAFWRFSRVAAILLVPYLGWVSFAAALNFWLWRANPGLLG
jgi:tryptophan-rich sensory protein